MKKFALKAAVIAIAGYLGVVGYIHLYDKGQSEKLLAEGNYSAEQQKVAKIFLDNGCQYCHSPNADLPFYANLPLADSILNRDIESGKRVFLLNKLLDGLKDPSKLSEVDLAKLERVIENNEMPVATFRHVHWGSRPDENEKTTLLNWIREQRKAFLPANTEGTNPHSLIQPIPDAIMTDPAQVELGRKLFMDDRLSQDGTVQCETCHQLDKGGVDRLDVSIGIEGKKGGINAPTVFNSAFNFVQFWDGRAIDLAAQAGGPPINPVEMGSHSWDDIVEKFKQDEEFQKEFLKVYPEVSQATLTHAIGEYEKTLITPNSDFDRYLKGDKTALNEQQLKGYELFKKHKCDTCHTGVNMGGQSYEYMGIYGDYFKDRGTPITEADQGRFAQTKDPYDMHRFKVPSLRNIALTAPYMHDASAKDLKEAVRIMLQYQSNVAKPQQQDIDDITSFLESLTGEFEGKKLQ